MYYKNIATLLVIGMFPLLFLAYSNYKIYKYMKISLNTTGNMNGHESRNTQEKDTIKVLIGIVTIFIICHALRIFLDIYDATTLKYGTLDVWLCMSLGEEGLPPKWKLILTEISDLMLVLNSSVNVIIYCCLNKSFRKNIFKLTIKEERKPTECNVEKEHSAKKKNDPIIWNPNFDREKSSVYIYS